MTIKYCSWATGDDTTGNGSNTLPYKTINKASSGLTGGDEVRVEKSPDPTALTGTVGFTLNSTAVTGSGTLFTTELVIGDFILAPDGQYYEVIALVSDTSATLYKKYPSASISGYSSKKLGVTDTGASALNTTSIQIVSSSGTSSAFLYISGGWDLSTEMQTGQTYFRQMHGTFSNRYGYGLYLSGKAYTNIARLHFLRYNTGIYYSSSKNNTCTSPTCNSNGWGIYYTGSSNDNTCTSPTCNSNTYGIYYVGSSNNTCTSPTCNSNTYGIYYSSSNNNTCTSPTCNSNNSGIYYTTSNNNTCTSPTCNSNTYGIYYGSSNNNTCTSPTCNSNSIGIYYTTSNNNFIYGTLSTMGNSSGAIFWNSCYNYINKASLAESTKVTGFTYYNGGYLYINDMNGQSYIYTDNGNIVTQNATAGGTGREWKFSPTNAIRNSVYPLCLPIARFAVASSGQVTITAYFKKSGTGVAGALRCRYGQIAWSDAAHDIVSNCPDDTSRNPVTLQFTPTEAGVVEVEALAWYVSSTTNTVIVDDITISQS